MSSPERSIEINSFEQEIERDFALRLLKSGNKTLFANLSSGYLPDLNAGRTANYYPYEEWLTDVASLFESFSADDFNLQELKFASRSEQEAAQDQLWAELNRYYWNAQISRYQLITAESSIIALQNNDFSQFLYLAENSAYEADLWQTRVLPTVQAALPNKAVFRLPDNLPAENQQYEVWTRVRQYVSIGQLKTGNTDLFLNIMSYSYYDPLVWRGEVVPIFTNVLPAYREQLTASNIQSNPLEGLNEQQDKLWAMVRDGQLVWNPDTKQYELTESAPPAAGN